MISIKGIFYVLASLFLVYEMWYYHPTNLELAECVALLTLLLF